MGDAGLMSSYAAHSSLPHPVHAAESAACKKAWEDFDQGPPGVRNDSLHDQPVSPLRLRRMLLVIM